MGMMREELERGGGGRVGGARARRKARLGPGKGGQAGRVAVGEGGATRPSLGNGEAWPRGGGGTWRRESPE